MTTTILLVEDNPGTVAYARWLAAKKWEKCKLLVATTLSEALQILTQGPDVVDEMILDWHLLIDRGLWDEQIAFLTQWKEQVRGRVNEILGLDTTEWEKLPAILEATGFISVLPLKIVLNSVFSGGVHGDLNRDLEVAIRSAIWVDHEIYEISRGQRDDKNVAIEQVLNSI